MRPALTTWLLGGLLALGTTAWAQVPPGSEAKDQQVTTTETTTTTTTTSEGHTVTKEEVKTWTQRSTARSSRPTRPRPPTRATRASSRPSAYVLPKGKAASFFRDNYDRDPKGIDFSIHGLNARLRGHRQAGDLRQLGLQNRIEGALLSSSPGSTTTCPCGRRRAGRRASATSSSA